MSDEMIYDTKYIKVAKVEDIPEGERLFIELDKKPVVLFAIKGEYLAIADTCSHDDSPLGEGEIEGEEIVCPRHDARFDLRTGKVLSFPAVKDIPVYKTRVNEGYVEIEISNQPS